jgi:hypothetical protein
MDDYLFSIQKDTDMKHMKDDELRVWAESFLTQCETNKDEWGIPADAIAGPRASCNAYTAALDIAQAPNTRSKAATVAKNEAKKALNHALDVFIAKHIENNDAITKAILLQLGLTVKDTIRTPIPEPKDYPEFFIRVKDIRALDIHFKPIGSASKARPYGYNGAVISYAVLDTPPVNEKELTRSLLATKTPYTLFFTEAERGKHVYISLVWQNEKGEKGPPSQIEAAIIP